MQSEHVRAAQNHVIHGKNFQTIVFHSRKLRTALFADNKAFGGRCFQLFFFPRRVLYNRIFSYYYFEGALRDQKKERWIKRIVDEK